MRRDNGSFRPTTPVPLGWCDAGGQSLGFGSKERVGDKVPCEVCGKTVIVIARFGDHGWPACARHKLPKHQADACPIT